MRAPTSHFVELGRAAFEVAIGLVVIVVGVSLLVGDDAAFWHNRDTVTWMAVSLVLLTPAVWTHARRRVPSGRATASAVDAEGPPQQAVSPATAYLNWLIDRRLSLPAVGYLNRDLKQRCRVLHEAARAGALDAEGADQYRDEQRNVVVMTFILLMLIFIGLMASADMVGLDVLHAPLVVLSCAVGGAHVVLFWWLARPGARSG
jgi:hypothetical protein